MFLFALYDNTSKLLNKFKNDNNMVQCILRAYKYKYEKMVLSPSIITKRCYKTFASGFVENKNPEVQLRNKKIMKIFNF